MRLGFGVFGLGILFAQPALCQSRPSLVGTWRVVKFCDRDSSGAMVEPLGPSPAGLFVYTPTGQLSIQVIRMPPTGPLAGEAVQLRTLSGLRPFYFGYFGSYTIRPQRLPESIRSRHSRPFSLVYVPRQLRRHFRRD